MVKPPGHTCPNIDKAQKQMRRLAWRARLKYGGYHDVDEVLQKGLKALEEVREENAQMRSAYYEIKKEVERLRSAEVTRGEA